MNDTAQVSPLTEAVYYILLSLYAPLHGYGIMQNVRQLSGERVNLGAGTLYGALTTLIEKGWIQSGGDSVDTRKKEYIITEKGKSAVKNEISRLEELIKNGKNTLKGYEG
ncbi:MAG: PadR family transcriptional regulator [Eubacteriales bacterium]